jgi:hypothetical protein
MTLHTTIMARYGTPIVKRYHSAVIVHYPNGDLNAGADVAGAILVLAAEEGTNEYPGDGSITRDSSGDSERRSGRLEVPRGVTVNERSLWLIEGEIWTTQRQTGRDWGPDGSFAGWLVTNTQGRRTQHPVVHPVRPVRRG